MNRDLLKMWVSMSGEAEWAHLSVLCPTLLGLGADKLDAVDRACVTFKVVMGVGVVGKNLS
jgi:hypothetical protein